ncbi:hypothetical protein CBER1_07970 [Cercospora berteroae]|uniref:Uncharacterized protein n=1 Tax=Cercospora berteroae TaxID=357750 RepID=A0A2S6BVH6_9PEZI|nr:hypothetical protein CBER1_07970 [Cercospora berteroae]
MENSPLGRLSSELRNEIYELALTADKPLTICSKLSLPSGTRRAPIGTQPALTKVCRQIRKETLTMFYHTNTFLIEVCGPRATGASPNLAREQKEVVAWLFGLERKHHASIRGLHLTVDMCLIASRDSPDWRGLMEVLESFHYHGKHAEEQKMRATVRLNKDGVDWMSRLGAADEAAAHAEQMEKDAVEFFEAEGLAIDVVWASGLTS